MPEIFMYDTVLEQNSKFKDILIRENLISRANIIPMFDKFGF